MSIASAIESATSDWQRMVIQEWARRNPAPARIKAGHLGWVELTPMACTCSRCAAPSVIIPDQSILPARGFVLCPNCSAAAMRATPPQTAEPK